MEGLYTAARAYLDRLGPDQCNISIESIVSSQGSLPTDLNSLWINLHGRDQVAEDDTQARESLLVALACLKTKTPCLLSIEDEETANQMYGWASKTALEAVRVAGVTALEDSQNEKPTGLTTGRLQATLAASVLSCLDSLLPVAKAADPATILVALASLSSNKDPWTTPGGARTANDVLNKYVAGERAKHNEPLSLWVSIESVLRENIKPLFARTKNPAITSAGRKNFYPIPLARFDTSLFEQKTKPWKNVHVYAPTVLAWVIAQYLPTDREHLEAHFPLLVPPILTLIDDDDLSFKAQGCSLLGQVLVPLQESRSNILRRTNLSSVFEAAITPCLVSLPTLTPEDESIRLLSAAYNALLHLYQTTYQDDHSLVDAQTSSQPTTTKTCARNLFQNENDKEAFLSSITKLLRTHLIPSFHHISSTNPASEHSASFVSFPYPRLSSLLLDQIRIMIYNLHIHTTKYLQDIVPLLYTTLANPFGTTYPPLVVSAVATARAVVLNAHPRLWRWRSEILAALCSCWLHVLEEDGYLTERTRNDGPHRHWAAEKWCSSSRHSKDQGEEFSRLKMELKDVVFLLRVALENPVDAEGADPGQLDAKENILSELHDLCKADGDLRELLLGNMDARVAETL